MILLDTFEGDRIDQIHPINAKYLLDTEPHRLYGDGGGNLLELMVERFASTVAEKLYGHGGIIALGYHDATTAGKRSFHNAFLLRRDGGIRAFHSLYGELPLGMDIDTFYMLLNSVEMNNWVALDPKKHEGEVRDQARERNRFARYGLGIKLPETNMEQFGTGVRQSIGYMRERYLRTLK